MKHVIILALLLVVAACGQDTSNQHLQEEIAGLQKNLDKAYKPGLGEFMSGIQVHHAKLWFAGEAQNWPLATFEINEIKEALESIKEFNADRPEVKSIEMMDPAMDSITYAVQKKDVQLFKNRYVLLTSTCNSCHNKTNHQFNVIKIPDAPPFSNQEFKVH